MFALAVNVYWGSEATIIDCKFTNNKAGQDGSWGKDGDDIFLQGTSNPKV